MKFLLKNSPKKQIIFPSFELSEKNTERRSLENPLLMFFPELKLSLITLKWLRAVSFINFETTWGRFDPTRFYKSHGFLWPLATFYLKLDKSNFYLRTNSTFFFLITVKAALCNH